MKINIFIIILLAIIFNSFLACTDLVNSETDSIPRNSAGGFTPGNPMALLESAYKDLNVYNDQQNIFAMGQVCTADLIPPSRGSAWSDNGIWRTMDRHMWDASHIFLINSWDFLNERVYKATEIIASNPTNSQKAEAQFLRAFNMFWVTDFFGQVPYREVSQGVDEIPRVMTRSQAFDFMVKDLTEALPDLSVAGPAPKNGKASKAAANFLLARLYLNKTVFKSAVPEGPYTFDQADMDKVISCVDAIAGDGYSLDADYFNAFSNNSHAETIFVSNEGTPSTRWFMTLSYAQSPSGWNGFATLANFYDKFEDRDLRKGRPAKADGTLYSGIGLGFLFGKQVDENGKNIFDDVAKMELAFTRDVPLVGASMNQGIRVIKYHPANYGKLTFMRYGEAVLMKAEAQFRKKDMAGALATVNNLRAVRKASTLSELTNDVLFDEIGREMYWEGFRRTMEVRFGKFTTGEGVVKKDSYTVLFPIPSRALISNPNLKQNNGYQQ